MRQNLIAFAFWPLWVMSNALGGLVGLALCTVIVVQYSAGALFSSVLIWIPLGLAQGLLLTLYVRGIAMAWTISSILGGFFSLYAGMYVGVLVYYFHMDYSIGLALVGGGGGLVVGVCQWFAQFDRISGAGWWILASIVGWAIAMFVEDKMHWQGIFASMTGNGDIIQGTASITVAATISGLALTWMLAYTPPKASTQTKALPAPTIESNDGTPIAHKQVSAEGKHKQTDS